MVSHRLSIQQLGLVLVALLFSYASVASSTLETVKKRGYIKCGVSTGLLGFSEPNQKGIWHGFDVEFCRAVAAAVLKDKGQVKFIPLTAKERFFALQNNDVDLLARNTSWTLHRDTSLNVLFTGVSYYDGQGFLVKTSANINKITELSNPRICFQTGTTTELNLSEYFAQIKQPFQSIPFDAKPQLVTAFEDDRCDVISSDKAGLYSIKQSLKDPLSAHILVSVISKEPLGPVVRDNDSQWFNIVKWTLFTLLNAEENRISSENIDDLKDSSIPHIARFLSTKDNLSDGLQLPLDWRYQIIKQVGNYGQIYERTLGHSSKLKMERGLNALWIDGGIQYAPPIR
ncbi:TPA: amino acid ABC transporter substrate-binding protein [Photobacterium damselae]